MAPVTATVGWPGELKATWLRCRLLIEFVDPAARVRRWWPDVPAELVADRLLAGSTG
jgi:hypothetical protein